MQNISESLKRVWYGEIQISLKDDVKNVLRFFSAHNKPSNIPKVAPPLLEF